MDKALSPSNFSIAREKDGKMGFLEFTENEYEQLKHKFRQMSDREKLVMLKEIVDKQAQIYGLLGIMTNQEGAKFAAETNRTIGLVLNEMINEDQSIPLSKKSIAEELDPK